MQLTARLVAVAAILAACSSPGPGAAAPNSSVAPSASRGAVSSSELAHPTSAPTLPVCSLSAYRQARDDRGQQPLLQADVVGRSGYFYDSQYAHACTRNYALAEFSHSSGSCFDYWLFAADKGNWRIKLIRCAHLDSPRGQPVFTRREILAVGLDPLVISRELQVGTQRTVVG